MKLTWSHLLASFEFTDDILESWRWLTGLDGTTFLVSAIGDVFCEESNGSVWWLDVGSCEYALVAADSQSFKRSMVENVEEWFLPQLVGDLLSLGLTLTPNQCFSYKLPPVLGGDYAPSNFEVTSIPLHFGMHGQIAHQAARHNPGTKVTGFREIE